VDIDKKENKNLFKEKKSKPIRKKTYLVKKETSGISIFRKPECMRFKTLSKGDSITVELDGNEFKELMLIEKKGKFFKRNDIVITEKKLVKGVK